MTLSDFMFMMLDPERMSPRTSNPALRGSSILILKNDQQMHVKHTKPRHLLPSATVVAERLCFHTRLSVHGGGRHAWWGNVWQGACAAGETATACSGRYESYWNAFFFSRVFTPYLPVRTRKYSTAISIAYLVLDVLELTLALRRAVCYVPGAG